MKALDSRLFVAVLLCPIAICSTAAISTSAKRSILFPPPPPQPPNILLNRDDVEDHRNLLQDPGQKLKDKGGLTVVIEREFKAFDSDEETKFKRVMSDATNRHCSTADNCYGAQKTVGPDDVVRYDLKATSTSRTAVSFYVKNPKARTELTMTWEQLGKMVLAERTAIEADLVYGLAVNEPDDTSDLPLYYWVITLALVIVLFAAVGAFVCCVHYRKTKRDSMRHINDIEMRGYHKPTNSKTPPGTSALAPVKRPTVTVDAETNVYQAEIIAETKTVFLRPPKKQTTLDANDNELYAVVGKNTKEEKQEKKKRDEEKQRQKEQKDEPEDPHPDLSTNLIVVTAEISSSNEGSHPEDDDVARPSSAEPPPAYHQVISSENDDKVTKGADPDVPGTSETPPSSEDNLPPPPSEDNLPPPPSEENLPPPPSEDDLPPPPDVMSDSASRLSQELPPPPDECKTTEDPSQDLKSSPPRKDSRTSSSPSSGKASSSAIKDVDDAVGDLENLIADQSKEIADQGLDNAALETVINDDGEPTTEL